MEERVVKKEKLHPMLKVFPDFCRKFLIIKTKKKTLAPLVFRKAQQKIWKVVKKQIDENKPIRIIILKARQVGCSTFCEALVFWLTVVFPNTNSLIIADEKIRAEALFSMSKRFYRYLDKNIKGFKPHVSKSNIRELVFDKLNSQFLIEMATKVKGGRTFTLHNIHSSETAFYDNPEELFTATLPSIPYEAMTCFIMESTSAGYGGYFHSEWKRAVKGISNLTPIFIAWYDWEDYSLPVPKQFHLNNEEKKLIAKVYQYANVQLTKEQIYWRRIMIRNLGSDGARKFKREFPSVPDEAFLAASNMYFPAESLEIIKTQKPETGFLFRAYTKVKPVVRFREKEEGALKIWYHPERTTKGIFKNRYVLALDTGAGVERDSSVIEVIDKKHMRQCAEYRDNRVHSDQLSEIVENVARYYNDALVAIELNRGEGVAVQDRLTESYGNIYYRETYDTGLRKITKHAGWYTTTKNRPIMLSRLREVIREAHLEVNSKQLLEELKSFLVIDGKPQGDEDDCVIAMAIATQLYDYIPDLNYQDNVPEFWKEYLDEDSITGRF